MTATPQQPEDAYLTLSEQDAALIERLIVGEPIDPAADPARVERARGVLSLLERWQAGHLRPGLGDQTLAAVLTATPMTLSEADGQALDALLRLREKGLDIGTGPVPADSKARVQRVGQLLALMDRAADQPAPGGLIERTMKAVEQDRHEQRRLGLASPSPDADTRPGGFNLRQLATTAALLLMVLSVLLPMLDKGQRDAKIAQCSENLAGLGVDLSSYAMDNKQKTTPPGAADEFTDLARLARIDLDGSEVPASRARLFVLLDKRRVQSEHLTCPSVAGAQSPKGYYSGQNPLAGGPLRVFVEPRPIFADTNPLYRVTPTGLVRNIDIPGLTRSANHDAFGQNVLISDGFHP